ncbi:NADPH oxidase organizer 1a [Synchiropus picturatus]
MERFPLSVQVIGVMHKEKTKMYMTSVLWTDQNDIVVYRTLKEFWKMHKQLKKEFPPANKLKKSDRILPKFRAVRMRSGPKKGPARSLHRLKLLQKYCDQLLTCDPMVSQSADLVRFFHPKDQDLQPEFSKNSVIIMPSEVDTSVSSQGGNVTDPFITETYRCVASYETKDTRNKPFKVAADEKVDVLIKDKAGWWLVEKEDKRMAWFPAPYLEKVGDDGDDVDELSERGTYTVVKNYTATKDDELTVSMGSNVEVLQKSDNGWWLIRYNGQAGYIPTMYLKPYSFPHVRMAAHKDHRAPSPLLLTPSYQQHSQHLSRSQGDLLQLPPLSSSSPQMWSNHRSHSMEVLSKPSPLAAPATSLAPPPAIRVDRVEDEQSGSDDSFASADFSLSSSSASSSFNLSPTTEALPISKTPPPILNTHLSPVHGQEGRMVSSVSDPNVYKAAASPKVPPRPQAQEILTRCSTVTRKNASRGNLSPSGTEIQSR